MANLCHSKCLLSKNQTTHRTSGDHWHRKTLILGRRGAFVSQASTSFHFIHHCLMEIIDFFFCLLYKWKTLAIKHFVSKSKFQDRHQGWRKIGDSLELGGGKKQKKRRGKDVKRGGREWNNEWSPSELSFPGRAPQGMQTLSHQKWATYLWKEWLLHPIWFGSPIIS